MQVSYWKLLCLGIVGFSGCQSSDDGAVAPWMPGQSLVHEDIDSGADESAAGAGGSVPAGCPLTPPTSCPEPKLHYADVEPIFAERCVSCHDGMHGQWALTTYQPIADWFGEVQGQMISCTMPPVDSGLTMPTAERMKILTWIRCGFPK